MILQLFIFITILVHGTLLLPTNNKSENVNLNSTLLKIVPIAKKALNFNILNENKNITTIMTQTVSKPMSNTLEALVERVRLDSVGKPDVAVGRLVASWMPGLANPEELTMYKHGDILHKFVPDSRGGIIDTNFRWPNGIVYYNISGNFTHEEQNKIQTAIEMFHKRTCIKFVPISGHEVDFVSIESGMTGCWSALGRVGGKQVVNLQPPNCVKLVGSVIHELMHALGFFHEQSRVDRDEYIKIEWQNVMPGKEINFEKYESLLYGEPYDYGSVMHYSSFSLSKNNLKTVIPLTKNVSIGQRREFSRSDVKKVRAMYMCPSEHEEMEKEEEDEGHDD